MIMESNTRQKSIKTILLIDDEADIRDVLSIMIESFSYMVVTAENCQIAKLKLKTEKVDMCLTDMNLPDGSGVDIIQFISDHQLNIPIAVFTAYGNIELAVNCLKMGAFDFISKPVLSKDLEKIIAQGIKILPETKQEIDNNETILLGESQVMENIRSLIKKISRSQAPVHISGASGSGKELAAKQIHSLSSRRDKPFIAINCGAIPKDLVESEFFGYKKGSFSGAIADKTGIFQAANQGTLFLDEIADLPKEMQVKLLRAIQEKKVRPIGSNEEIDVDIRILSATHKNLEHEVNNQNFREDLFFRINVIPLHMPTLAEHIDDIDILCNNILNKIDNTMQISNAAINALKQYSFPGNVRELENIIERACAMCDSKTIDESDLLLSASTSTNSNGQFKIGNDNISAFLEKTEQEAIYAALEKTNGNKTKAAELLGISFRSLRYKLTKIDKNHQ